MTIIGPKPWVNPFGKMPIFRLFELCGFIAQKGAFWFYCLQKQTSKNGHFWTKSMQKCQFFNCLKFSFLQPRKVFFGSRISKNTFSWPILPKKKVEKKRSFLDQNHGLTPFEKCQFLDFLNFVFLQPSKVFFGCRIS